MITLEEAKQDIPNIDTFCDAVCRACTSNDWYCTDYCDVLEKARTLDYKRILKAYARNYGDLDKVCRYIRRTK